MNVNFSATENVTLTANTVTTNSQGYAENTLRHNAPVTSAVTATVATDLVGLTEDVRFVAGAGARIELFRLNDGAVADGIQTNRVEARSMMSLITWCRIVTWCSAQIMVAN